MTKPPESTYGQPPAAAGGCCAPVGRAVPAGPVQHSGHGPDPQAEPGERRHAVEQVTLPGGVFAMGDAHGDGFHGDGETPVHLVELSPFTIDATSVTNADFARFTRASGYVTEAESFGYSAVFHLVVAADPDDLLGRPPGAPWWVGVRGADWQHPEGRHSGIGERWDHPVVHVSWNDARAYCAWAGRSLPTEAQWEYASRGGLPGARYPWGDELLGADGAWQANIWQGTFPEKSTKDDGFITTAPVRSYQPNGYGLWQTVGNVWEWCEDTFSPAAYSQRANTGTTNRDPCEDGSRLLRVMRGGSYLCHESYCNRYRNAARSSNTPDSSTGNTGFRTVAAGPGGGGSRARYPSGSDV
jgi:formylglycine-generating enzyme